MKKNIGIAAISFFVGLLAATYIFIFLPEKKQAEVKFPSGSTAPALSSPLFASTAPETKTNLDFVAIAEKVGPAVLKIESQRVETRRSPGFDQDFPFDDFWNRFFGQPSPREREPQKFEQTVQGTGFYISSDGYILTNNHLVEKSSKVTVFTTQGKEYPAKVIGTDPKTDLALLKIEAKDLPAVELGDSAQLKVGEWVLAIGNPLGMEHTVTAGIVSAKGRQLGTGVNVPDYQDFIQTDASINRGNSGGPLVNMKGEVIGVTSNILSPTGGSIGIGFAIPSNLAKKIVIQLKEKGRVVRGRLGVYMRDIDEGIRKQLNLKNSNGAVVTSVEPDGPAEKVGFKPYDVIVEINGQPVQNGNDLRFKIADIEPGSKVKVTLIRDGREMTLVPTVEEMEPREEKGTEASPDKNIGLTVVPLTPSLARRYSLKTTEGLLITEVRESSEAERKGIAPGDIILEVNRNKVLTVRDLERILKKTDSGEDVMLLVRREGEGRAQEIIVTLRVP